MINKGTGFSLEEKMQILSNISKCDTDFRQQCIIAFQYCPITRAVDAGDEVLQVQTLLSFLKRSKTYDEFKDMVEKKDWLQARKLSRKGLDVDLDNFMEKYKFCGRQ
eukprot:12954987-Ditylum_brightwellii.AAC.1